MVLCMGPSMMIVPSLSAVWALLSRSQCVWLNQLENHFIGNRDPNLHFALLSDFTDAPQKELPGEHELIQQTIAGIQNLNERHGAPDYQDDGVVESRRVSAAAGRRSAGPQARHHPRAHAARLGAEGRPGRGIDEDPGVLSKEGVTVAGLFTPVIPVRNTVAKSVRGKFVGANAAGLPARLCRRRCRHG